MSKMRPMAGGKEAAMNTAAKMQPKAGHMAPAGPKSMASAVGNEKKADVKAAQGGSPADGLGGAMAELKRQHPQRYDDMGPHHGGMDHIIKR